MRHPDHPIPSDCDDPSHLGDGAYVSHDTYQFWVSADSGWGFSAVALDNRAVQALVDYARARGIVIT